MPSGLRGREGFRDWEPRRRTQGHGPHVCGGDCPRVFCRCNRAGTGRDGAASAAAVGALAAVPSATDDDKGTNSAKEVGKAVSDTVADGTGSSGGGRVPAVPAGGGLGVVGIPGLLGSGGLGSPGLSGSAPASGGGDSRPGHDGRDPLGPASLGAFAQMPGGAAPVAGASATGAPAGILGLNPALAALTGTDAQGLLSGAALLASIASSGAPGAGGPGGSGNGDDVLDK